MTSTARLADRLDAYGYRVPAAVTEARAIRQAIADAAAANPVTDLAADLAAGKLTAENAAERITAAAVASVAADRAHDVARDLGRHLDRHANAALLDEADAIIEHLRPTFDTAAARLAATLDALGPDATAATVLRAGTIGAQAWQDRTDALATLADLRGIRVALAQLGYGPRGQDASWYLAAAPDAHTLANATALLRGDGNVWIKFLAAGYDLRLNTATEAEALTNGARRATEATEAEAREGMRETARRKYAALLHDLEMANRTGRTPAGT
jgi:hypothetical protein